jgi:hypothetical protein
LLVSTKGERIGLFDNYVTLPNTVRSLPYTVRIPRQRSTKLSYQDSNQAQLHLENAGDITGDNNSISPDISPTLNTQNHAQNSSFGDTGYTGDILHTSSSLPIYRLGHSDTFACKDCKQKGDIHYMKQHNCRGSR